MENRLGPLNLAMLHRRRHPAEGERDAAHSGDGFDIGTCSQSDVSAILAALTPSTIISTADHGIPIKFIAVLRFTPQNFNSFLVPITLCYGQRRSV